MTKEKRILVLDSTILNSVQKCGYYTFLSFVKHLRAAQTPEPFERGDLTHHILEHYYKTRKSGGNRKDATEFAVAKGREKYPSLNMEVSACEWVIQSFYQYEERWANDGLKVLEVEKPFMMKIYEDDELICYYSGKIDLIAELPLIGVVPIDHKSRTRMNEETLLNNQFMGYAIHTDSNFVYVNEFGLQKTKTPEEKFRRIPLSYNDELKAHWLNDIVKHWVRTLDYYLQENVWPEQWNPYICKSCIFADVCKSGTDEEKARKLTLNYVESEPWDVTKALEGGVDE